MQDKKVWHFVLKTKVPNGRKRIGNTWVFNEKGDGHFRARTCGKGFGQVPGKDFYENRMLLSSMILDLLYVSVWLKCQSTICTVDNLIFLQLVCMEIWMKRFTCSHSLFYEMFPKVKLVLKFSAEAYCLWVGYSSQKMAENSIQIMEKMAIIYAQLTILWIFNLLMMA